MSAEVLVQVLLAYLCGSIMGGPLIARLRGGVDLRASGSGNVGATNALRVQGPAFAGAVLLIDLGKGVIATLLIPLMSIPLLAGDEPSVAAPFLCGAAAVLGHVWPIFSGFRGGKGAATLAGALMILLPPAFALAALIYAAVLIATGFAGLSMLIAASLLPFVVFVFGLEPAWPAAAFALFAAAITGLTHRENVRRMRLGTEPRFEKVMLWARLQNRLHR